jgi:hypothetical protein
MRSYMNAYGYKNISQAYRTMASADLSGKPCEKCGSCSVNCTSGFDVRNKIMDIARLRDVPEDFLKA